MILLYLSNESEVKKLNYPIKINSGLNLYVNDGVLEYCAGLKPGEY